ncbi:MAG: SRPBCC domain-containing protein [Chloroflexi bacterium]|nr:SRPBCC domain-containing protein [Chloroflexota bacterium]
MTTQEISLEQLINETPEAVYYAWTNEMALTQWLCQDARVAVQPHGRLYLYWPQGYHATGEYQQVEANKALAFSWRGKDEAHSSRVAMTLTQVEGGTRVHLLHSHIAEEAAVSTIQQVWEAGLANLQAVLETGLDNRLYNRPFMGIMLQGQLTAEQLAARGVPANGAVELGGALPGTSAAEAGLQAQDLLIQIGDKAIETMPDIGQALQGKQIGDSLPLTVYRNGQPTTSTLTLRRRPAPHVPPTAEAFSAELGRAYAAADAQLDEILVGASDAVAWQSPAPGEWSAAEVLAHLIICERMVQTTVGVQLNGNPCPTGRQRPTHDSGRAGGVSHLGRTGGGVENGRSGNGRPDWPLARGVCGPQSHLYHFGWLYLGRDGQPHPRPPAANPRGCQPKAVSWYTRVIVIRYSLLGSVHQ